MGKVADVTTVRQLLARPALFAMVFLAGIPASQASATEPVALYPCPSQLRPGAMDESGTITRPTSPAEQAVFMTQLCDRVVLGRFVSVADSHYHETLGPPDEPVVATFHVSEVLWGEPVTVATIGLERDMLAAPGQEASRYLFGLEVVADGLYRHELANEMERGLESIRDSGEPLTRAQHERFADALKRLVEVPPRTRYQRHELVNAHVWMSLSALHFHNELGAIRPDEAYLLGVRDQNATGLPYDGYFNYSHTYLFWGREAQDIAAALREMRE